MTLIVAMANDDIGFMVGDTLLTPLLEVKGNPIGVVNGEFHGLKIQILDGNTGIAFATSNSVAAALTIISQVQQAIAKDPKASVFEEVFEAYQRARAEAKDTKPDCEFLILKLEGSAKRLAHVTDAGIRFCERAHIGDQNEYKRMTSLRKPYLPPKVRHVKQPDGTFITEEFIETPGAIEFAEVSSALEDLVQQRNAGGIGAIGGNIIRVCDALLSGELEYLQVGEASFGAAEGRSGFSLLASNAGVRGVGIYYKSGKIGFVLISGDIETCRKEESETIQSFIDLALQKYGMHLVGPT